MKKGYDRLTNGISSKFSIDYKYYSKNGRFQLVSAHYYTIAILKIKRLMILQIICSIQKLKDGINF